MQFAERAVRTGDLVLVRRHRWRVIEVRVHERCQLVTLTGAGAVNSSVLRRFLLPFDTISWVRRPTRVRFVRPRRWRRACRALVANQPRGGGLLTAGRARIDLLPHQLEPALAVVRGGGSRVLLADDVGLGKTIQAGLVITELRARGLAERVLVLTPAGVREQWAGELADRFAIDATVVDFRDVRRRVASLPVSVNPWATIPVAIASLDYVKRPETLSSLRSCQWDVLVVDEAHRTAADSDRHAAVSDLAGRAGYVLLLTATPHNGDRQAFSSLCETGGHGDSLLVFRRTRSDVMLGTSRRVHRLQVRPSGAEAHMHALLHEFTRLVEAERGVDKAWLALSVLHKRALSSAFSLAQTVGRRLATLESPGIDSDDRSRQLALPFADAGGEFDSADAQPAWAAGLALDDQARERRLLLALFEVAMNAARRETKFDAVFRLLRRIAEPMVIFTEYRDTLNHLREALGRPASVLHGGLTREERHAALGEFVGGRCPILLATDAAGEGLNLHQRCRVVVNLELPWNPMRLEQRIGRVDRIGQRETIHVFHLIARETGEERILDRLQTRIARAGEEITAPNPLADERTAARLVMRVPVDHQTPSEHSEQPQEDAIGGGRQTMVMRHEAAAEAERLEFGRRLTDQRDDAALAALEGTGTWVTTARLRHTRRRLGKRVMAILRVECEDGHGRIRESQLVPIAFQLSEIGRFTRQDVQALLRAATAVLQEQAEEAARQGEQMGRFEVMLLDTRLARERAVAQALLEIPQAPRQAGLFDRRVEREYSTDRAAIDEAVATMGRRIDAWSLARTLTIPPPRLLLVLAP